MITLEISLIDYFCLYVCGMVPDIQDYQSLLTGSAIFYHNIDHYTFCRVTKYTNHRVVDCLHYLVLNIPSAGYMNVLDLTVMQYYTAIPVVPNDTRGVGPFLLAAYKSQSG
jgi:hypothetical protein